MTKVLSALLLTTFLVACGGGPGSGDGSGNNPVVLDKVSCDDTAVSGLSVSISWSAPSQYMDNTPMNFSEISSYRIYVGTESMSYTGVIEIADPSLTSCSISVPASGQYYVAMTTVLFDGRESGYSNEVIRSL